MGSMDCDYCKGRDFNEVVILRKSSFTTKGKHLVKKTSRVCLKCARRLAVNEFYKFGYHGYWHNTLLNLAGIY